MKITTKETYTDGLDLSSIKALKRVDGGSRQTQSNLKECTSPLPMFR
jgi:hypothetical protein